LAQEQHCQRAEQNYRSGNAKIYSRNVVCFVPDFWIGKSLASAATWKEFGGTLRIISGMLMPMSTSPTTAKRME
jgi:hypothetical protein